MDSRIAGDRPFELYPEGMEIKREKCVLERRPLADSTATDKRSGRPCNSKSILTVVVTKHVCIRKNYKQDSAWSWLICFCGVVSNIIALGNVFSFGVLNPVLLEKFQQGKARTAWIGSLCIASTSFFGPVVGKLCDRLGNRIVAILGAFLCLSGLLASSQVPRLWMLYLTYSGLIGFGTCCIHIASCLAVSRSFYRRRSLATGMLLAGRAASILICPTVWHALLVSLGWQNSFLVMAAVSAPILILACTFETDHVEELRIEYPIKQSTRKIRSKQFSTWTHPPFVMYTISSTVLFFGIYIPLVHMATYCKDLNIDGNDAARLYLVLGLTSLVSGVVFGRICDNKLILAERTYQGAGLAMGLAIMLSPLAKSYAGLMAYFVVLGFSEGAVLISIYYLVLNCVPDEARSKAFGFWLCSISFTLAAGPPLAGFLADELGSYVPTFYVAGGIIIISSILVFFLHCFKKGDALVKREDAALINEDVKETDVIAEKITVL